MIKKMIILVSLLLAGCASAPLEVKWRPLKQVKESWIQPDGVMSTIGDTIYTSNLVRWKKAHDVGTIRREYVLRHERVHSFRQEKYGVSKYLVKYATDKAFRWREEKLANYAAINYLISRKIPLDVDNLARFLSGPAYYDMISYKEAETFIKAVLTGTWKPDGELPVKVKN